MTSESDAAFRYSLLQVTTQHININNIGMDSAAHITRLSILFTAERPTSVIGSSNCSAKVSKCPATVLNSIHYQYVYETDDVFSIVLTWDAVNGKHAS